MEVAKTGKPDPGRCGVRAGQRAIPVYGNPVLPRKETDEIRQTSGRASGIVRGSVETLHHPPAAGLRVTGARYGEEKVQTPNRLGRAAKAVAGMNQQVVGSSPSAGSIRTGSREPVWPGGYLCGYVRQIGDRLTGGVPERSKGADCKSVGSAFGGSNPPPSTIFRGRAGESGKRVKSNAGVVQRLEPQPSKLMMWVRFPSPAPSARNSGRGGWVGLVHDAHIAQSVEHFLGKEEVTSSSLVMGSSHQVPGRRGLAEG